MCDMLLRLYILFQVQVSIQSRKINIIRKLHDGLQEMLVHKYFKDVINETNLILQIFAVFKVNGKNFKIYIVLFELAFMLQLHIL